MSDLKTDSFPAFRPRPPWFGSDLQTLRNRCRQWSWPDLAEWAPRKLEFPMNDGTGDVLPATLQWPDRATVKPLVVLVHGLTGCEDSSYIRYSARHWLGLGYPTLRVNMRAAGPARATCRQLYHAGRSEDLRAILGQLTADLTRNGVILIGYSIGANIMLKYLGEEGDAAPIKAAASVSAPIDLAHTSRRMLALRNRVYTKFLLSGLKRITLAGEELSDIQRRKISRTRNVYQFDEVYIAPRNGFRDPEHYYASCSAFRFLPGIRVPTLIIHAPNDPWIPIDAYRRFAWEANDRLVPLLDAAGGHVGFHGSGSESAWHDRCVAAFLKQHGLG